MRVKICILLLLVVVFGAGMVHHFVAAHASSPLTVYVGSVDGTVSAFDSATGATRWQYNTGAGRVSLPTVMSGTVYVSAGATLFAFDTSNGQRKWQESLPYGVSTQVALGNGMAYVGSGYEVEAVNASTGALIWHVSTPGVMLHTVPVSVPVFANGTLYINPDGMLYALNALTGAVVWKVKGYFAAPTVSNGVVYAGSSAFRAIDGKLIRRYSGALSTPSVVNGVLYASSWDRHVYAFNASTGALVWKISGQFQNTELTVANGTVFVGSYTGYINVLSAQTGGLRWRKLLDSSVTTQPSLGNGEVYVSSGYQLYALNAVTGTLSWSHPITGPTSPIVG